MNLGRTFALLLIATSAAVMAGCHPVRDGHEQVKADVQNDDQLPIWLGRSHEELIKANGSPLAILDIFPLMASVEYREQRNNIVSYVYSSSRGDGCIDAYVITLETGAIVDYFCR